MEETFEGIKDGQEVPKSDNLEITEIHCHECDGYIKFALDKSKNGEHVVICPKCKHEHCRIIKDGVVTGDRWTSRNKPAPVQPTPAQGPVQQPLPVQIQTFYVQVGMDNYSPTGWQTIKATGGSTDPFLNDAWDKELMQVKR